LFITSTWHQYFSHYDEGLGTTYERFILHRYFEKLHSAYDIQSVLEMPSFGMTGISGINSIWWAKKGARVTVADADNKRIAMINKVWQNLGIEADFIYQKDNYSRLPFKDRSFDLSWNFASLWFVKELEEFLRELVRVTRRAIFICVPNRSNIASIIAFEAKKHAHVFPNNIRPDRIKGIIRNAGWRSVDQGFFDAPPWPDIAMKKEDLLRKAGLGFLATRLENKRSDTTCILDYYGGKNKGMEEDVLKYAFLEQLPDLFKQFWAHHRYFIFAPP